MADHATYGPSTLKARALCPGWVNDKSSDPHWADEGAMLHKAWETGNLAGLDPEQTTAVQQVITYTAPYERSALFDLRERRIVILRGLTFGTADRIIGRKSPTGQLHIDLLDAKFGRVGVDDASENLQGIAYAIGVFEEFKPASVTVHFLLPRRDEVTTHRFTRPDLPDMARKVREVITRAQLYERTKDASMLRPSEDACQYCGRKSQCPAINSIALSYATKYAPLEVVDEVHSSQVTDPERMARLVSAAKVLQKWCDSVMKHSLAMVLEQGITIPGYEVKERAGAVEINNPVLAYEVLTKAGLDPIEIVSAAKLSKSKLEDLVKSKAPRGKGAQSIRDLNAALASAECISSGEPVRYLQKSRE